MPNPTSVSPVTSGYVRQGRRFHTRRQGPVDADGLHRSDALHTCSRCSSSRPMTHARHKGAITSGQTTPGRYLLAAGVTGAKNDLPPDVALASGRTIRSVLRRDRSPNCQVAQDAYATSGEAQSAALAMTRGRLQRLSSAVLLPLVIPFAQEPIGGVFIRRPNNDPGKPSSPPHDEPPCVGLRRCVEASRPLPARDVAPVHGEPGPSADPKYPMPTSRPRQTLATSTLLQVAAVSCAGPSRRACCCFAFGSLPRPNGPKDAHMDQQKQTTNPAPRPRVATVVVAQREPSPRHGSARASSGRAASSHAASSRRRRRRRARAGKRRAGRTSLIQQTRERRRMPFSSTRRSRERGAIPPKLEEKMCTKSLEALMALRTEGQPLGGECRPRRLGRNRPDLEVAIKNLGQASSTGTKGGMCGPHSQRAVPLDHRGGLGASDCCGRPKNQSP